MTAGNRIMAYLHWDVREEDVVHRSDFYRIILYTIGLFFSFFLSFFLLPSNYMWCSLPEINLFSRYSQCSYPFLFFKAQLKLRSYNKLSRGA